MEDVIGISIKYVLNDSSFFEDTMDGLNDMLDLDLYSCGSVEEMLSKVIHRIKEYTKSGIIFPIDSSYAQQVCFILSQAPYRKVYGFVQFYI